MVWFKIKKQFEAWLAPSSLGRIRHHVTGEYQKRGATVTSVADEKARSNSSDLVQYSTVRVRQLEKPLETYNGWNVNQRPPAIGDVGTIVDVLEAPGMPSKYIVESSGLNSSTAWLGEFCAAELESMNSKAVS